VESGNKDFELFGITPTANMAELGGAGDALAANFPLEQWFFEMPFCTRWWTAGVVLTSVLVQCHVISPFNMFYSTSTIFKKGQVCISAIRLRNHGSDVF
jgi:hypothetical protein